MLEYIISSASIFSTLEITGVEFWVGSILMRKDPTFNIEKSIILTPCFCFSFKVSPAPAAQADTTVLTPQPPAMQCSLLWVSGICACHRVHSMSLEALLLNFLIPEMLLVTFICFQHLLCVTMSCMISLSSTQDGYGWPSPMFHQASEALPLWRPDARSPPLWVTRTLSH